MMCTIKIIVRLDIIHYLVHCSAGKLGETHVPGILLIINQEYQKMYEIVYCSKASRDLTSKDISSILQSAHSFNSKHDITGCLLYHNHEFLQILEGDKDRIQDLYSIIYEDDRHTDVIMLAEGEKEERTFSEWSMAYQELSDEDVRGIGKELFVSNFIAFSELVKKDTFPMILFWNLAKQLLQK